MKIRDKLEAEVLARDAEKLALTSQPSLGDTWLILGAHYLHPPAHQGKVFRVLLTSPEKPAGTLHPLSCE